MELEESTGKTDEPNNIHVSEQKKAETERQLKRKQQKEWYLKQLLPLRAEAHQLLSTDKTTLYQQFLEATRTADRLKCISDYSVIENDLLELTQLLFTNQSITVYKFGSRISGIGSNTSDLDIFVDIGNRFKTYENHPSETTLQKLYQVRDALKNRPETWINLIVIDKVNVPILRVVHAKSNIECDINFSNGLGYVNTSLMQYIFSLQPIARLMCIYMKEWLIRTGLKAAFCTHIMNTMIIFYLQHLHYLPPIEKILASSDLTTALIIGPWLGTFVPLTLNDLKMQLADSNSLLTFLQGFFKFYLTFDFENQIVCPYAGVGFKKEKLYTIIPNRYTTCVEIEVNTPMFIQDPIQLDNNISKSISELGLLVFKELMKETCQTITRLQT